MNWFEIEGEFRSTLLADGLGCFETLATKPLGKQVSKEATGREVRRLTLTHEGRKKHFFLKRVGFESPVKCLRMLLYGKRPRSGAVRERMMLSSLKAAGLPAMNVVA